MTNHLTANANPDSAAQRCVGCGGVIVYGEQAHRMRVTMCLSDGPKTVTEVRCRSCAEQYAADFWPEDFGPCPYQMWKGGHA